MISSDENQILIYPTKFPDKNTITNAKATAMPSAFALNCISIILVYTRYFGIEKNADKERIFVIYNSIAP